MREDESVNAWGVPILRYSEEDVVKQKFIQTIHRVEWRDRSNTQFHDPDPSKVYGYTTLTARRKSK